MFLYLCNLTLISITTLSDETEQWWFWQGCWLYFTINELQIDIYLFNASKVGKMIRWRWKNCLIMTTSGGISKNDLGIMITTKLLATSQWRDMYVRFEQIGITITILFLDWLKYIEKEGNILKHCVKLIQWNDYKLDLRKSYTLKLTLYTTCMYVWKIMSWKYAFWLWWACFVILSRFVYY